MGSLQSFTNAGNSGTSRAMHIFNVIANSVAAQCSTLESAEL